MPPPTGNALIDGVMPLFRLLDAAAAAEPLLMWLAWTMVTTALAALPAVASRVPSLLASLLLIVPGAVVWFLSFVIFSMLLSDLVRLHPFLQVAIGLGVSVVPVLAGWRYAGNLPRQMQAAEVTLRLARPALVVLLLLVALTLHPFTTTAAMPALLGAAVFVTEVFLGRMMLAALKRSSTSRSSADLLRFRCVAPVYVLPDGSMLFIAAAVGLTHQSSSVFLQQHVEDALHSDDPAAVRRATRILAHEAGHVVQHHGMWRVTAASVLAATLPFALRTNGVGSMAIITVVLIVVGLAALALGEWAAERFADRAGTARETHRPVVETVP